MLFRSLADAGIAVPVDDRRLIVEIPDQPLEVLLARTDDIPTLVADGAADAGVAGGNQLLEHGDSGLAVLTELGYGPCALVIAAPADSDIRAVRDLAGRRIATSHPNLLQRHLAAADVEASIVALSGSIELAPAIGAADAVCDLV